MGLSSLEKMEKRRLRTSYQSVYIPAGKMQRGTAHCQDKRPWTQTRIRTVCSEHKKITKESTLPVLTKSATDKKYKTTGDLYIFSKISSYSKVVLFFKFITNQNTNVKIDFSR